MSITLFFIIPRNYYLLLSGFAKGIYFSLTYKHLREKIYLTPFNFVKEKYKREIIFLKILDDIYK